MSLNGLDDAKVKEAHDAAVGEPGGWYVYTSTRFMFVFGMRRLMLWCLFSAGSS
jgi:hypothetical protein